MNKSKIFSIQILVCLFVLSVYVGTLQAETTQGIPIYSLPYTITIPGVYYLTEDHSLSLADGNAITINADNVVLDLNGYNIGNVAAGSNTKAVGIYAWEHKNITIRNGTISGFQIGIRLNSDLTPTRSKGHVIEDIRADKNRLAGIYVSGFSNIIRNNHVIDTGGIAGKYAHAYGIYVYGPKNQIINNIIIDTKTKKGFAYGIHLDAEFVHTTNAGCIVENNYIVRSSFSPGTSYGIYAKAEYVMVLNNRIIMMENGIYLTYPTSLYAHNFVSGSTTAFSGGTDGGGNFSN